MSGYVPAKEVYKELRGAVGPWAAANGFRRWPGTVAGWQRAIETPAGGGAGEGGDQVLRFMFEGSSPWADADTGHALTGRLQLDPSPGDLAATPIRQSAFSSCLIRPELARLAAIQGAINRRRPALPRQYAADFKADTRLGHHLRSLYEPSPSYREGQYVDLSYWGIEDVREWTRFILDVLPAVLDRFLEGRTPAPIDTTPEHLKIKWPKPLR